MRLIHTDEQQQLQAMLREVFTDACPPPLVRQMKESASDGFPSDLWQALTTTGVFGLAFDPEYGGDGAGIYELGLVFAEAGRALCPTIVYSSLLFGVAVERLADAEHKKKYLPALAAGELKASTALSNPSNAGDRRPRLTAERGDGGWTLSGTLMFVPNAAISNVLLVSALTSAFPEPARTYAFFVDPAAEGIEVSPLETFAGDKQSKVVFDGCFVPDSATLSGPGGHGLGSTDLAWVANAAVALQCMEMVGGATAVLERTVDYVKVRQQFGRAIAGFQAAQHHVANMRIALEAARLAATQATWWIARGHTATRAVAIAKMHCSEAYKWTTLTSHQLHGGMGYVRETDLHLWSERAKVTEIQGGTADVAARWLQAELGLVG